MKDFFEYIKYPIPLGNLEKFTLKVFIKFIGLSYILSYVSSLLLIIFKKNSLLPEYRMTSVDSIILFLAVSIFLPLIEEIVFRLNLKISKRNFAAFLSVIIVLIVKAFFLNRVHIYIYLGTIPIFGLVYYTFSLYDFPTQKIETFWKSNFKYIFHFFAIFFGILHLTNFETIYWWMIVISPLLTAPYITSGYILGYIRMKYGFTFGWLIHSTINFISVMLALHKGIIVILIITIIILITNYLIEKVKKQNSIKLSR
jgi:membrane protease YdiL (CAAX protease family)